MRRSILQTKFYLLSVLLSLASCSQDELAEQGTPLPDGMYPMTFTAVQVAPENMPQTRVSEDTDGTSSRWDGGEVIKVTVSGTGNNMETTCTLDENGDITAYNPQLYWQNTNSVTVNAWYSNITGQSTGAENTVSLTDQSGGLAYVLKADPVTENYKKGNIALTFSHQLAKIRVKLVKGSYEGDFTVKVKGYTSCTVKNGEVSEGRGEGYITMHKNEGGEYYEANLVPGTLQALDAFEIRVGDKTTKASLKEDNVILEKGIVHEITINVEGKDVTITKDYTIEDVHKPIIINGNCTVTFKNARITSYDRPLIKINDGCKPTLVFEGTNVLKCNWDDQNNGSIKSGEDDEYNIKLEDGAKLAVISECAAIGSPYRRIKLNISGNGEMWVQSNGWNFPAIIVKNGSLSISEGVVLTAVSTNTMPGNSGDWKYVPAIGLTLSASGVTGGSITLRDCTLKLYAYAMGGKTPEHWVTLENGTVSPDVDSALKPADWDTEISLGNGVKAKKLKNRPELPDWATK